MGRFRVPAEDEDWRGQLVPLVPHCPQNNDIHPPSAQQRTWGGFPIQPPSVAISRPPNREEETNTIIDQEPKEYGLQPHFYEYPQPPPPPRTFPWFRMVVLALVAHLVARYGPVAPPPDATSTRDSWEDFWVQELRGLWRSAKLIGYTTPHYVAEWVAVGLYDDVRSWYHRYRTYHQERARLEYWSHCALQIPDDPWNLEGPFPHESDDNNNKQRDSRVPMVGQTLAVSATTQAMDAWTQTAPLLLYFAGDRGVGKLELARQVILRIFGHCTEDMDELFQASGPVMMLQGRDFALQPDEETVPDNGESTNNENDRSTSLQSSARTMRAIRVQLYESIIRQAQSHPNGTAVILQHVEDLAEGLLATLVQDLTNPSRHASSPEERYSDGTATDAHQSLASRLQEACGKVLFIMTSTVGAKTIAKSRQGYGSVARVRAPELVYALMHEMDMKFATSTSTSISSATSSNPKPRSTNRVDVGSKFHALAPFFPLEQASLAQILAHKIDRWSSRQSTLPRLRVTSQVLDALLDESRVEYLTVWNKATQEPLLTYSSAGGQFLRDGSPLMNGWQASVKRCFFRTRNKPATTNRRKPLSEGEVEGNYQQEDRWTVLDYDSWSRKAMVLVCPKDAAGEERMSSPTSPVMLLEDRAPCEEICRFAL